MRLQTIVILIFTLAGFALRFHYAVTSHPFFDEYTTVLAARQILRHGWPMLPSGLFYEHGLLATYLITPFTALYINTPLSHWQPAHWGLMLSRWPSVLLSTATIPLIYSIGRRGFKSQSLLSTNVRAAIALLAAGLFAVSPEGMVWGGRARMYALATFLVLLTVYWAYRGTNYPAPATYRWWALLALLATLLTQFGAMILIPPLVIGTLIVGWLSWYKAAGQKKGNRQEQQGRAWFLQPTILLECAALAAIIGLAIVVKRLGRPLGVAALGSSTEGGNLLIELFNSTVAYQTTFYFTWTDTIEFLSRQFGLPHHLWLTVATLCGIVIGLIYGWARKKEWRQAIPEFSLFLWLVFGLIVLLMVTFLEPFRRNPRYIVMFLPLFYLIAAQAIFNLRRLPELMSMPGRILGHRRPPQRRLVPIVTAIALLILFTGLGLKDLRIALLTPEPAYEQAFARIRGEWQPGDSILTMNTPAAELYLGQADGFTVQVDADQFLLETESPPVDRWLGTPWVGGPTALNAALNRGERTWFVIDTIRQPVYFRGNWLAVVNSQMEQVWAGDNALVYRTRPDRLPIPTEPETVVNAILGDAIRLAGYTLQNSTAQAQTATEADKMNIEVRHSGFDAVPSELRLILFWQPLAHLSTDYTSFLHLRNQEGATVAQRDRQPLNGMYPTSHWQPNETVIDPITLPLPEPLPEGTYRLLIGLYQLDTLERLPVAEDSSGENAILLGEIRLP